MDLSPPRPTRPAYKAHHRSRWEKEKAAAGGVAAFDSPNDPRNLGHWVIGETVGKGASGRVKIAKHDQTGQLAAVKILPLSALKLSRESALARASKQQLSIERECAMMKLMDHPNIMHIFDALQSEQELYLVLEYVPNGELFDYIVNHGPLPAIEALKFFKQIVNALNYAHTFSIIHRDLKPENILIESLDPVRIKIADWGMAAFAPTSSQLETSCGSPHYASPEIINGIKYDGPATDIWSCGVILYALLTGRLPFDDKNMRTLLNKVRAGSFDFPRNMHPDAKDLIGRMLVVDVNKRITMPDILAHRFLQTPTNSDIVYAPLPSMEEIARPVCSPSDFSSDVMDSLFSIFGQRMTSAEIRQDLMSPQGENINIKAFFQLLVRFRDCSMEHFNMERGEKLESKDLSGKQITVYKQKHHQPTKSEPRKAPPPPSPVERKPRSEIRQSVEPTTSRHRSPAPPTGPRPVPPPTLVEQRRQRPFSQPGRPAPVQSPVQLQFPLVRPPPLTRNATVAASPNDAGGRNRSSVPMTRNHSVPSPRRARSHTEDPTTPTRYGPDRSLTSAKRDTDGVVDPLLIKRLSDTHLEVHDKENRGVDSLGVENQGGSQTSSTVHMPGAYGKSPGPKSAAPTPAVAVAQHPIAQHGAGEKGYRRDRPPPLALAQSNRTRSTKRNTFAPASYTHSSPLSPTYAPHSEVRGWFTHFFNFRAPVYVSYSTQNCLNARDAAHKLLSSFGIECMLEDAQGWGVLRCRAEERVDIISGSVLQKAVRFRVDLAPIAGGISSDMIGGVVSPTTANASPTVYASSLTFSCEKGAVSTFKATYTRFVDEWRDGNPACLHKDAVGTPLQRFSVSS